MNERIILIWVDGATKNPKKEKLYFIWRIVLIVESPIV